MIDVASLFGLLGSITASSLFFPQVWQSYKTKKTKDLAWFGTEWSILGGLWVFEE